MKFAGKRFEPAEGVTLSGACVRWKLRMDRISGDIRQDRRPKVQHMLYYMWISQAKGQRMLNKGVLYVVLFWEPKVKGSFSCPFLEKRNKERAGSIQVYSTGTVMACHRYIPSKLTDRREKKMEQSIWQIVDKLIVKLDDLIWGVPLMVLILLGGILLTVRTRSEEHTSELQSQR